MKHIQIISKALKSKEVGFTTIYKSTAAKFKKAHGIELSECPKYFVKAGFLYLTTVGTYKFKGRTYESVSIHPICEVGERFKRMERNDITTGYWNN